uniref:Uncharacterized protein n=1 Tax=Glossina palpalis gambiensis TaxID=67801 RepID=A0A1B0B1Z8_9MUSC
MLVFGDSFNIVMPSSPLTMGREFKVHFILMGISPFCIIHCKPAFSPVLTGSSPKAKGLLRVTTMPSLVNKRPPFFVQCISIGLLRITTKPSFVYSRPPFFVQYISIGKSPLLTVQEAETISNSLILSSPKSKGMI